MSDWPALYYPAPTVITPFSPCAQGMAAQAHGVNTATLGHTASTSWTSNNKAYFYPFHLNTHETAYQLLFFVGGTSSGNIDVGIYDSQKNLLVSAGSTAMSATVNTWQELNITDTPLPPGDYLLAGNCSTTGGTCFGSASSTGDELTLSQMPVYEQAVGATALPDPCTPVACTDGAIIRWAIGIQLFPTF